MTAILKYNNKIGNLLLIIKEVFFRFNNCHISNLNGYNVPAPGSASAWINIAWYPFTSPYMSLAAAEMAIR
jgi:hypothetical protein